MLLRIEPNKQIHTLKFLLFIALYCDFLFRQHSAFDTLFFGIVLRMRRRKIKKTTNGIFKFSKRWLLPSFVRQSTFVDIEIYVQVFKNLILIRRWKQFWEIWYRLCVSEIQLQKWYHFPDYNWILCTKCCGTDEEKSTRVYKIWFETHAAELKWSELKCKIIRNLMPKTNHR